MTTITETQVTRKISKVKLIKSGGVLVEFEQTIILQIEGKDVNQMANVPYTGLNLPHPDLLHAFELLRVHLAILCDQLDGRKVNQDKLESDEKFIEQFKVTGFTIGGSGEHEGVTLTGSKAIKRGIINLNSPFTKFEDTTNPYEYEAELAHLISHLTDEAEKYVDGKIAPNAQTDFLDELDASLKDDDDFNE